MFQPLFSLFCLILLNAARKHTLAIIPSHAHKSHRIFFKIFISEYEK